MLSSCKPGAGRAGRAKPHARCEVCAARAEHCFCGEIESIELGTRIIAITHQMEAGKPTNTARLLLMALTNAQVRVRGRAGEPMGTRGLVVPDRRTLMLFPSDDAVVLTPELVDDRPITLVVPDGTWRQACRVPRRVPELSDVERVKLAPGPPSRYRLRSTDDPGRLSTFEAVARALGVIEGAAVRTKLERDLEVMVDRTLRTRGHVGDQPYKAGWKSSR